jgi:hypothetical protein
MTWMIWGYPYDFRTPHKLGHNPYNYSCNGNQFIMVIMVIIHNPLIMVIKDGLQQQFPMKCEDLSDSGPWRGCEI